MRMKTMSNLTKSGLFLLCSILMPNMVMAKDVIDTESEFLNKVAERKISVKSENTWLIAKQDGQIDGRFRGLKIRGKWNWSDGFWCRSARIGILPIPRECQQLSLADETLILQRFRGTGSSHTYQIN